MPSIYFYATVDIQTDIDPANVCRPLIAKRSRATVAIRIGT